MCPAYQPNICFYTWGNGTCIGFATSSQATNLLEDGVFMAQYYTMGVTLVLVMVKGGVVVQPYCGCFKK